MLFSQLVPLSAPFPASDLLVSALPHSLGLHFNIIESWRLALPLLTASLLA